jgi:Na+(H+)/acetate symporter ActP
VDSNKHIAKPLVFLIMATTAVFGGMVLDYFLLQNGVRPFHVLLLSNVFMAATVATSLLLKSQRQLDKQQALADRLATVEEMNRHLHNALTAIAFYGRQTDNEHGMQVVSESLSRIDDLLRGVLSKWRLVSETPNQVYRPRAGLLQSVLKFGNP